MAIDLYGLMEEALEQAALAFSAGEVPVGAVVADQWGNILARAHNRSIALCDPTGHAEILALREASLFLKNYRLTDSILVSSIEPCVMCMGAALNARVARVVFGSRDPSGGAAGSLYNFAQDKRMNHRPEVISGIREEECLGLIQEFFRLRRHNNSKGHKP